MAIKTLKGVMIGKGIYKHMPFIGFLAIIAMVYIANAHHGEKSIREIQVLEKEAKEEHWRYMSAKSRLTQNGRSSSVENMVVDNGLQVAVEAPRILLVKN